MTQSGLTRIVVGVDFSPPSLAAARWVAGLFGDEAEVTLVYAVQVPHLPSFLRASGPGHGEIVQTARTQAEESLADLASGLPGEIAAVEVRVGKPSEEIAAVAQERNADLVVTGPHGKRSGLRGFLGSTAEQLLRVCPVPVLVVTAQARAEPRRILAPVDESDLAGRILATARNLARKLEAEVTALHAVHPGIFRRIQLVSSNAETAPAEQRALAEARTWLEEQLESAGFADDEVTAHAVVGEPAHEIVAGAARIGADLIVMGSRGSSAPGQFLLGGAARVVLSNAPCPVLVITDSA